MNFKLIVILMCLILSSCDLGSGNQYEDIQYKEKLYLLDTDNGTAEQIGEGNYPIFLSRSGKIIYRDNGLRIYNIETGETVTAIESFYSAFDEHSVSSDDKYLLFRESNSILRLNLETFETDNLVNSQGIIFAQLPVRYSNDDSKMIFMSSPPRKNDFSNSDSAYVYIYNFKTHSLISPDTVFFDTSSRFFANFSSNSQLFYVIDSDGYDYTLNKTKFRLAYYSIDSPPEFISGFDYYRRTSWSRYWNSKDGDLIFIEINGIFYYDLALGKMVKHYFYNSDLITGSLRITRESKYIVGADTSNTVEVMNLEGKLLERYASNINGRAIWVDYAAELHKIILQVEVETGN